MSTSCQYGIDYNKDGNNIKSGFLNFTKLLYNLAWLYTPEANAELQQAKEQIEAWEKELDNEEKAQNAILATLRIFNPKVKVSFTSFKFYKSQGDYFGTVQVTRESDLSFEICKVPGHTYVKFDPYTLTWEPNVKEVQTYQKDPLSTLLLQKMRGFKSITASDDFYYLYTSNEPLEGCNPNSTALMFLDMFRGAEQNTGRIGEFIESHPQIFNSDIEVNDKTFQSFLLGKYSIPYETLFEAIKKKDHDSPYSSFGEFLRDHTKRKPINKVDYFYVIAEDSVSLFYIPSKKKKKVEIEVPKTLQTPNKEYKVTRIDIVSPTLKQLHMSGECDDLEINFVCENIEVIDLTDLQVTNKLLLNPRGRRLAYPSLRTIKFPSNYKFLIVGDFAFYKCPALETLEIPKNATIGNVAFFECNKLSNLRIAENVTIGDDSFDVCPDLETVEILKGVTIGDFAFARCNLSNLRIDKNVTIKDKAFRFCCSKIKELTIPNNLYEFFNENILKNCQVTVLRLN